MLPLDILLGLVLFVRRRLRARLGQAIGDAEGHPRARVRHHGTLDAEDLAQQLRRHHLGWRAMSREEILSLVWGDEGPFRDPHTVDVHVRWLREKIESNPAKPERLLTIRGVGYKFAE